MRMILINSRTLAVEENGVIYARTQSGALKRVQTLSDDAIKMWHRHTLASNPPTPLTNCQVSYTIKCGWMSYPITLASVSCKTRPRPRPKDKSRARLAAFARRHPHMVRRRPDGLIEPIRPGDPDFDAARERARGERERARESQSAGRARASQREPEGVVTPEARATDVRANGSERGQRKKRRAPVTGGYSPC